MLFLYQKSIWKWRGKMLCATIRKEDKEAIRRANRWADLIELSLPLFTPSDLYNLRKQCQKPVIFKLKDVEFDKLSLLPDYVDLPHTTSEAMLEQIHKSFPQIKRICSYHDYDKTKNLDSIFSQLSSMPAEIYKITTMAHSTIDCLKMLQLVKRSGCIGICMGEIGTITRILAPVMGAPWTYIPDRENQRTALGQILLKDLLRIYNYKKITSTTSIYGLIGDSISKSLSDQMHNFAFKKLGLDAVYLKMPLKKGELKDFFYLADNLGFKGLSVTMPFKKAVTNFLDYHKHSAINTLEFTKDGLYGWNTDGVGALNALEKKMLVKGGRIVLLGAGGAAYGIAKEAKKRGAHLIILNRTLSRAEDLAKQVEGEAYSLKFFPQIAKKGYDILVNSTSIGMEGDLRIPIPAEMLLEKKIVMDIISRPKITPLLAAAQKKNCEIIQGMEMFIQQAVEQYCHWFKEKLRDYI